MSSDLEGSVTGCNEAAVKIFGWRSCGVLGRTLAAFISGDDGAEQRQLQKTMLAAVLQDGAAPIVAPVQEQSSEAFTAELSVTLLRDGSAPIGMVGMISVTERKMSLPAALNEAQGADAEEDEKAHTVSRQLEGASLILASPLMHRFMRWWTALPATRRACWSRVKPEPARSASPARFINPRTGAAGPGSTSTAQRFLKNEVEMSCLVTRRSVHRRRFLQGGPVRTRRQGHTFSG